MNPIRPTPHRPMVSLSLLITLMVTLWMCLTPAHAVVPSREELKSSAAWFSTLQHPASSVPGFSFRYNDRDSTTLLSQWNHRATHRKLDRHRTEHTRIWTDPATGLVVRWVAVEYHDFPAVEWTVYLRNDGKDRSPLVEAFEGVDTVFPAAGQGPVIVHHANGAPSTPDDYAPRISRLTPGQPLKLATTGGRGSNTEMPYFRVAWGDAGVVCAIGWPGQWSAELEQTSGFKLRAGQENTHFRLEPGEEARSPLIALVFWSGDEDRGHNLWRAWMVAHNLPRPGGKPVPPHLVACSSHQFNEMLNANEQNQKQFIDRYLAEGLGIDHWWMDAGWYINDGSWVNTGTWEVDRKRFPNGLRAVTDHAHARGLETIVWFEPERVTTNSALFAQHPDWCLDRPRAGSSRLLNLGNPEARKWLENHIDQLLTVEGIDLYRQDFNIDPLPFWRANDTGERQGLTENHYITGYLAYWDELQRRHPRLLIDSCASGGRRNDLETMRRAVPFLRSDHLFEPVSQQAHTYGASFWLPHHGTGTLVGPSKLFNLPTGTVDVYAFRSHMCPTVIACWDVRREDLDYSLLRRLTAQLKRAQPYYNGDYHPLTEYSLSPTAWMAWQFHREQTSDGLIQAFRRAGNTEPTTRYRLRGLEPGRQYEVEDADGMVRKFSGRELMTEGLSLSLPERPAAALLFYRRAGSPTKTRS